MAADVAFLARTVVPPRTTTGRNFSASPSSCKRRRRRIPMTPCEERPRHCGACGPRFAAPALRVA